MIRLSPTLLTTTVLLLAGCGINLTQAEANEALEEAQISSQAMALTSSSIELTTSFTIGDAAAVAAGEIQTFIETQLPCAQITLSDATLTINYGGNPGLCIYRGQTYSGTHEVSVMSNEMNDVVVMHTWTAMQNQTVSVTGTAMVTWSASNASRRVMHDLTWTRMSDGRMGTGTGDRTQEALTGGIFEGFSVDGEQQWVGASGTWTLTIDNVEMRWVDPVPQAGSYTLETPAAKTASIEFVRQGPNTIQVTVSSGTKSFDFDVATLGDG